VLAGPIVRVVDDTKACVWVALSRGATVMLDVIGSDGSAASSPSTTPVKIGDNL
jgi:hypothetical protein